MKARPEKKNGNPSGKRRRQEPATIRQRQEPDPVDVVLGDSDDTRPPTRRRDTDAADIADTDMRDADDTDNDTRHASGRQRQGDATPTGDTTPPPPTATPTPSATPTGADAQPATATPGRAATPTVPRPTRRDLMSPADGEAMKSVSYSLPPSLIERVRAAQWHTQLKPDGHHNVSELVRRVLLAEVERLERAHNGGVPFPRVDRLPTGPSPRGAARGARIRAAKKTQAQAGEGGEGVSRWARRAQTARTRNPASEGGAVG